MIPKNEYAAYFEHYIQLVAVKNRSIIENLQHSQQEFDSVFLSQFSFFRIFTALRSKHICIQ